MSRIDRRPRGRFLLRCKNEEPEIEHGPNSGKTTFSMPQHDVNSFKSLVLPMCLFCVRIGRSMSLEML